MTKHINCRLSPPPSEPGDMSDPPWRQARGYEWRLQWRNVSPLEVMDEVRAERLARARADSGARAAPVAQSGTQPDVPAPRLSGSAQRCLTDWDAPAARRATREIGRVLRK